MAYYLSSPVEIILLCAWLFIFALVTWRKLEYGALATVFLLPAYLVRFVVPFPFFGVGQVPTTLLEIQIYILFFIWVFREAFVYRFRNIRVAPLSLRGVVGSFWFPLGLILFGGAVSTLVTPYTLKSLGVFKGFLFD